MPAGVHSEAHQPCGDVLVRVELGGTVATQVLAHSVSVLWH